MANLVTIAVMTTLAFLGGLLTFKIKTRWCTACGTVKSCPRCTSWAASVAPQRLPATTTHHQRRRG